MTINWHHKMRLNDNKRKYMKIVLITIIQFINEVKEKIHQLKTLPIALSL